MTLGQRIAMLRKEKSWTQSELAEKLQMNANHVSRWEKDRIEPRRKVLLLLAEVFGVTIDDLMPAKPVFPVSQCDPELSELMIKVSDLGEEQRKALRVVLRSMLTCQQLEKLVAVNKEIAA